MYVVVRGRPEVLEVFPCCERGLGLPPLEALAPGRGGGAVLPRTSSSRPAAEAGAGGHGRYGAEKADTTEKKCDRRLLLQKKSE